MQKCYQVSYNIGHAKYVLQSHDGMKVYKDKSPFFDLDIFSNKRKFQAAIKRLQSQGYARI